MGPSGCPCKAWRKKEKGMKKSLHTHATCMYYIATTGWFFAHHFKTVLDDRASHLKFQAVKKQTNVLRERCKWKKCNRSLQKEHTSNVISTGKMFVARPRTIWGLINPYPNRKGGPNKTCEPISCQQERLAVPSTRQQ